MTLKNNRAPLLCCFQLCAWFHCHMWIQTGVRVRKRLSWVLTSVTLTFDLWPWPFAWTSLLAMVITPENCMMIRWWEHGEKGVTDRQTDGRTDGRTDGTSHIAAWSQLKILTFDFHTVHLNKKIMDPHGDIKCLPSTSIPSILMARSWTPSFMGTIVTSYFRSPILSYRRTGRLESSSIVPFAHSLASTANSNARFKS